MNVKFSAAEVEQNRQGRLSKAQDEALRRRARSLAGLALATVLLYPIGLGLAWVAVNPDGFHALVRLLPFPLLGLCAYLVFKAFRAGQDRRAKVVGFDGVPGFRRLGPELWVTFGRHVFACEPEAIDPDDQDQPFRLFTTGRTHTPLSLISHRELERPGRQAEAR